MNIDKCFSVVIISAGSSDYEDQRFNDIDVVLSFMNVQSMEFENFSFKNEVTNSEKSEHKRKHIGEELINIIDENNALIQLTKIVEDRCKNGVPGGICIPVITDLSMILDF